MQNIKITITSRNPTRLIVTEKRLETENDKKIRKLKSLLMQEGKE